VAVTEDDDGDIVSDKEMSDDDDDDSEPGDDDDDDDDDDEVDDAVRETVKSALGDAAAHSDVEVCALMMQLYVLI